MTYLYRQLTYPRQHLWQMAVKGRIHSRNVELSGYRCRMSALHFWNGERVSVWKQEPLRMEKIQRDVLTKCCSLIQFLSKSVVYLCIVALFSQCTYLYFLWTLLLALNWQYNWMIRVGDASKYVLQKRYIKQYWISNSRNDITAVTVKSFFYCYITAHIWALTLLTSFTELVFLIQNFRMSLVASFLRAGGTRFFILILYKCASVGCFYTELPWWKPGSTFSPLKSV